MSNAATYPRALVIGAGPAGAVAATVLARALGPGSTRIVDHAVWPRSKVCGCCLGEAGIDALRRLNAAPEDLLRAAQPLTHVHVLASKRRVTLPHDGAVAIDRLRLDAALLDIARGAGAIFSDRVSARVLTREHSRWRVRLSTPDAPPTEHDYDVVIVADGLSGTSLAGLPSFTPTIARRSWIGVGTIIPARTLTPSSSSFGAPPGGVIAMHLARHGYVGLVRLSEGDLAIGAALEPNAARAGCGPLNLINAILRSCDAPDLPPTLDGDARLAGTGLLTRSRRRVALPGLFVVGDSAGYVEPFTGEGMTWAIISGSHAARLAAELLAGDASRASFALAAERWTRDRTRLIQRRQRACRAIRSLLRRPMMTHAALEAVNRIGLARSTAHWICRSLRAPYPTVPIHSLERRAAGTEAGT